MSKPVLVLMILGTLASACSTAEPPARLAASGNFCADKAAMECQAAINCGNSVPTCQQRRTQACNDAVAEAALAGRQYAQDYAQPCLDKTKSLYAKTAPISPADFAVVDDACQRVLQGSIAVNQACPKSDYDCSGKLICDKGFCANAVTKQATEPCANPGETCAKGSYCAPLASGVSVCQAKKAKGATCSSTDKAIGPCLEDFRCTTELLSTTCSDRIASGGACTPGADECAVAAPYCDVAAKKCVPGAIFGPSATELCKGYGG